jgi:hypothetical protein
MYESESTHAYDEIVKYQNGLPLQQWLDAPAAKTQAELRFRHTHIIALGIPATWTGAWPKTCLFVVRDRGG